MIFEIPMSIPDTSVVSSLFVGSLVGAVFSALRVRVATSLFVSVALSLMLVTRSDDRWDFGHLISGLETSVFLVDRAVLKLETLWLVALLTGGELLRRALRSASMGEGRSVPGRLGGYLVSPLILASPPTPSLPLGELSRRRWLGDLLTPVAPSLPWLTASALVAGLTPYSMLSQLWPLPVAALCGGLILLKGCQGVEGPRPSGLKVLVPALAMVVPVLLLEVRDFALCLLATGATMSLLPHRHKALPLMTPRPDITALLVMACAISSLSAFGDLTSAFTQHHLPQVVAGTLLEQGGPWILGLWALILALVSGSFPLAWLFILPFSASASLQDPTCFLVSSACAWVGSRLSPFGLLRDHATVSPALRLAIPAILTLLLIRYLS